MKQLCVYRCGQEGKYKFQNGNWCCSDHRNRCPAVRSKMSLTHKKLHNTDKREQEIKDGLHKCYICGEKANYYLKSGNYCCGERANKCPGFHDHMSKILIESYKNDDERKIKMSDSLKIAQNKPETKRKKSNSMKKLHRTDPEFQENYKNGREKFKELVKELCKKNQHWKGDNNSYSALHIKAGKKYKKTACEICGCTHQLCNSIYSVGLHLHNIAGDCSIKNSNVWVTLCPRCHIRIHKMINDETKVLMEDF